VVTAGKYFQKPDPPEHFCDLGWMTITWGGQHAPAAEFPSIRGFGSGNRNACPRADGNIGGWPSQRRNEQRHIDSEFFRSLDASGFSVVRTAGIRPRPSDEQIALAAAAG
jgi:hypothetical protein